MKTLIKSLICLLLCGINYTTNAQNTAEQTYYASIQPETANTLFLDVDGTVKIDVWDKDYILLYIIIECDESKQELVNELRNDGRYAINMKKTINDYLILSQPNLQKWVSVNGIPWDEKLRYEIKVPKYMDIEVSSPNDMVSSYKAPNEYADAGNLLHLIHMNK